MADEITVLGGDGSGGYSLLLLFPIDTPKRVGGTSVVPTPSSGLPALAAQILTVTETTALDTGAAAFRVVPIQKDPALTNAQLAARVRAIYDAQRADFDAWYASTYRHAGTRLDAQ